MKQGNNTFAAIIPTNTDLESCNVTEISSSEVNSENFKCEGVTHYPGKCGSDNMLVLWGDESSNSPGLKDTVSCIMDEAKKALEIDCDKMNNDELMVLGFIAGIAALACITFFVYIKCFKNSPDSPAEVMNNGVNETSNLLPNGP